jgi:hypothetical protein
LSEKWDVGEANRLTGEADCIEREFLDTTEMAARIDAEWDDARRTGDDEAFEQARAANRRLIELCTARELLWRALAEALEDMDLDRVRVKAEVIKQTAADQFRRRQA